MAKFALITGGTRGIGYGIAEKLAETGHDLILGYNSNLERAENARNDLTTKYGVRIFIVKGDVAKQETIRAYFEAVKAHFGDRLNVVVHNAGLVVGHTTSPGSDQAKLAAENPGFHHLANGYAEEANLEFNLYDYYQSVYPKCFIRCVERALPLMKDGEGYIIAISSPGCNSNSFPMPNYLPGPGKAVLEYLVRNYAIKLAPRRITCNCVIPGLVRTEPTISFVGGGSEKNLDKYAEEHIPMKTIPRPENIGDAVAFLCSPKAAFITGVSLDVDGALRWAE